MKKIMAIALVCVLLFSLASCREQSSSTETSNSTVTPKRVVAITVASMQYLNALEVDVVGIPNTEKEIPERYKDVQKIGQPMSPNLEMVLATEPDIVIADSSSSLTLQEMLYGQDVELVLLDNNSYESVGKNIQLLAEKLNIADKGREVNAIIENKKQEALLFIEGKTPPKIAIIFGTTAVFMLATEESYVGDVAKMIGAENITEDSSFDETGAYITFDREKIAEYDPDVILRLSHADPEETAQAFESEFQKPFWQSLKAVQNGRVIDLDPNYFGVVANYDSIEAPIRLAELIYE